MLPPRSGGAVLGKALLVRQELAVDSERRSGTEAHVAGCVGPDRGIYVPLAGSLDDSTLGATVADTARLIVAGVAAEGRVGQRGLTHDHAKSSLCAQGTAECKWLFAKACSGLDPLARRISPTVSVVPGIRGSEIPRAGKMDVHQGAQRRAPYVRFRRS